jgi:hypothetical protein
MRVQREARSNNLLLSFAPSRGEISRGFILERCLETPDHAACIAQPATTLSMPLSERTA